MAQAPTVQLLLQRRQPDCPTRRRDSTVERNSELAEKEKVRAFWQLGVLLGYFQIFEQIFVSIFLYAFLNLNTESLFVIMWEHCGISVDSVECGYQNRGNRHFFRNMNVVLMNFCPVPPKTYWDDIA